MVFPFRQQKQAKEEEKAAKTAEKAAEEAAAKAKQIALEEENRKKREDERQRREAAKRLAEEERLRKEEERKKRQQEERERELERERKKKEKEDKLKKDREEKERKAREEREARLAKEREEKAERERIEKEKREEREKIEKEKRLAKEKEEKAEKEAKEKLAAQQRAAAIAQAQQASAAKPPTVQRNATASSSTSALPVTSKVNATPVVLNPAAPRSPNSVGNTNGVTAKKVVNNKHIPPPASAPATPGGQMNRPHHAPQQLQQPPQQMQQQPNLSRAHHPLTPINAPHFPLHLPPLPQSSMMFGHPQGPVMIPPPALSPRVGGFPPMQYPFGAPNMPHHPPGTPLAPRNFNGPPFDANFNRGMPMGIPINSIPTGAPAPIGPPKNKVPAASTSVPNPSMLAPGQGRRGSIPLLSTQSDSAGPGPITRPIAPIARPTTTTVGETASSGSGSPSRRSPSPKGVLGSSALAADDDEVVSATGPRRVGAAPIGIGMSMAGPPSGVSHSWGAVGTPTAASPRAPMAPWAVSGFSSPSPNRAIPNAIGSNSHLHQIHPGVPPIGNGSLWGNTPTSNGDSWHPQTANGFFPPAPGYMNHNAAASSAPHAGS